MAGKMCIYCGLLLTTLTASPAIAENGSVPADYFENLPLVLTASRLKQSAAEAPSAVSVIDHEMIVASGARQIVDLLRITGCLMPMRGACRFWWMVYRSTARCMAASNGPNCRYSSRI